MAIKKSAPVKARRGQGMGKKSDDGSSKLNVLPNTFRFAAETLKTMSERGGSAGSIVVSKYKSYNYKLVYALVMNTIKNIKIIKKIIHETKLCKKVPVNDIFLLEILVGDLLFGKGLKSVEQNSQAAAVILQKEAILKQQNLLKKNYTDANGAGSIVKYIRVNNLKSNIDHIISQLKAAGLNQLEYSKEKIKFKKFINKYINMDDNQFMVDFHFPSDLILVKQCGAEKMKRNEIIQKGKASFQDKASFMAVEAMQVERGQKLIDACFAPGGKTSLMANKMRNHGKIFAFDLNKNRFLDAIRFLKVQGVTCCKPEVKDFTKVNLRRLLKVNNIEYVDSILLDPSCSGSGIKNRIDYKQTTEEKGRLKKLQAFQVSLLKHALKAKISKYIVYCTCSTSQEENEEALQMALKESGTESDWKFVDFLPYWPERGLEHFEFGKSCVRSNEDNLTNGFFIAKLELVGELHDETKNNEKLQKQNQKAKDDDFDEEEDDQEIEDDDDQEIEDDDDDEEFESAESD